MNTTTRLGKIARLPHSVREQLNLKLHDNIPAKSILPWLNSLPESKIILASDFDNRPITRQNLSEWKHGGFRDWLLQFQAAHFLQFPYPGGSQREEAQIPSSEHSSSSDQTQQHPTELTEHATRITDPLTNDASRLTAKLLLWTQLQYISMARSIDALTDPDRKWSALRHFATDISRLKRSSLADDYLQIQRDWLALSQSNSSHKKEKQFWDWTKRPDIEKKLFPNRCRGMNAEELYQFEKDTCLMDGPGAEIAELMAEVRIAKKLLELRKAKEAEAKAKAEPDYDPDRPLPDTRVKLAGMPFEELFPAIPDKPLTETYPELDNCPPEPSTNGGPNSADHPSDESGSSDESSSCLSKASEHTHVQPSPTKSNQIQPPPPLDPEFNPSDHDQNKLPNNFQVVLLAPRASGSRVRKFLLAFSRTCHQSPVISPNDSAHLAHSTARHSHCLLNRHMLSDTVPWLGVIRLFL